MMTLYSHQDQKGVTLIEALVAMAVFALALSLTLGIMNNNVHQQRKINAEQKVASNARDVIEAIAREVRMGSIDYMAHKITNLPVDDLIDPVDHLYLKSGDGQQHEFKRAITGTALPLDLDGVTYDGVQINSNDVDITGLSFFIRPISDPFYVKYCTGIAQQAVDCDTAAYPVEAETCLASGMCKLVNDQPRVTIVLSAELRHVTDPTKQSTITLQTTVTTRKYQR